MTTEMTMAYAAVVTGVASFLGWDKRQDKLKIKENAKEIVDLNIVVARQDERHKALVEDVRDIKNDTKEIKDILMGRMK